MSFERVKFHALQYKPAAEGCPDNLTGFFNHDRFEWSPYENHPERLEIKMNTVPLFRIPTLALMD